MTTSNKPLALVTGASSGIGLELARQFAQRGFDLVINAEDANLDAAAEQLRSTGANVQPIRADLRSPQAVQELYAEARSSDRSRSPR
jgi:short-subunit dehydrogenase